MSRFIMAVATLTFVAGLTSGAGAADPKVDAILDKAVKALGGEDKLAKLTNATWKSKGKLSFGGMDADFTIQSTVQGLDHRRSEFEGNFGGNDIKAATVVAGDKGWRSFAGMSMPLDADSLANENRLIYLDVIPAIILPLKGKDFKVEAIADENVEGKPAAGIKATDGKGKDFTLFFDKASGLPVRSVAKVLDFMGQEFTQETLYSAYKDMGGIQKATKVVSKRDGEKFIEQDIIEFKGLDKVDPKTFAEPQ